MKANELMIGDWVHVEAHRGFNAQNVKVETIPDNDGDNKYGHHYGHIGTWLDGGDNDFRDVEVKHLQPILLTPEILEKNGFKKSNNFCGIEGQHKWTWWDDILTNVSLWCRNLGDKADDGWMISIESPISTLCVKVEFLHQLQHALRLCGIEKTIELWKQKRNTASQ